MFCTHRGIVFSHKKGNEALTHATTRKNLGKKVRKGHILYNFIYIKCPEKTNP